MELKSAVRLVVIQVRDLCPLLRVLFLLRGSELPPTAWSPCWWLGWSPRHSPPRRSCPRGHAGSGWVGGGGNGAFPGHWCWALSRWRSGLEHHLGHHRDVGRGVEQALPAQGTAGWPTHVVAVGLRACVERVARGLGRSWRSFPTLTILRRVCWIPP